MERRTLTRDEVVFFSDKGGENDWMSFSDPRRIQEDNTPWGFDTIWHALSFREDCEWLRYDEAKPRKAPRKSLAFEHAYFAERIWATKREEAMMYFLKLKLERYPELKSKLKATGDKIIAYACAGDEIWGIGHGEEDEQDALRHNNWGSNLIGKAWMKVRDEI